MNPAPAFLAAILLVSSGPAEAQPAPVANAPTEAQIDRFVAALPDQQRLETPDSGPEPSYVTRIIALNPGRETEMRALLSVYRTCRFAAERDVTIRTMRTVARNLGAEKLERITLFYERHIIEQVDALVARGENQAAARLAAGYPLDDFSREMRSAMASVLQDPAFIAAERPCRAALQEAAANQGLRLN